VHAWVSEEEIMPIFLLILKIVVESIFETVCVHNKHGCRPGYQRANATEWDGIYAVVCPHQRHMIAALSVTLRWLLRPGPV